MPGHVCYLYDEVHRIFFLGDNLVDDPNFPDVQVRIQFRPSEGRHYLIVTGNNALASAPIRLGGVEIPPDTGEALFLEHLKKFAGELFKDGK